MYATEDGSLLGIQNKLPAASPSSNMCVDLLRTRSWAGAEIFPRVLPAVHRYVPASRCLTCLMDNPPLGSSSIELQKMCVNFFFLYQKTTFGCALTGSLAIDRAVVESPCDGRSRMAGGFTNKAGR